MATLDKLREVIDQVHGGNPQRHWHAMEAVNQLEAALKTLASHGHLFDLVEGEAPAPLEWPKMFYHESHGNLTVASQSEADALGPDWKDKQPTAFEPEAIADEAEDEPPPPKAVTVDIASIMASGQAYFPERKDSPSNG